MILSFYYLPLYFQILVVGFFWLIDLYYSLLDETNLVSQD